MAVISKIEWTDLTWNPVTGCTKISPGCKYCYAEVIAERFRGVPNHPYEQGFSMRLWPQRLELPLKWKKPRRIFVNSMSDLIHPYVPDEFIDRVFETIPQLEPRLSFYAQSLKNTPHISVYFSFLFAQYLLPSWFIHIV